MLRIFCRTRVFLFSCFVIAFILLITFAFSINFIYPSFWPFSMDFYSELKEKMKGLPKEKVDRLKLLLVKKYGLKSCPPNFELVLRGIPVSNKPTRSGSGVSVIAMMAAPFPCPHGKCIMCPGGPDSVFGDVPQSYTGKEPATMRGIRNKYDPYLQVFNRLEQYVVLGHEINKIELIIMGGTFPSFPKKYQDDFVAYSLKAMNDFSKLFFTKNKFNIKKFKKFFYLPGPVGDPLRTKKIHQKLK